MPKERGVHAHAIVVEGKLRRVSGKRQIIEGVKEKREKYLKKKLIKRKNRLRESRGRAALSLLPSRIGGKRDETFS